MGNENYMLYRDIRIESCSKDASNMEQDLDTA